MSTHKKKNLQYLSTYFILWTSTRQYNCALIILVNLFTAVVQKPILVITPQPRKDQSSSRRSRGFPPLIVGDKLTDRTGMN